MVTELFVPRPRIIVPKPKSYVALDMAFGVGEGATLFDKSRYRSHGAIIGASWAAGLHGKCLDFDPTIPSYVEIPASHTQLNFTSEDFSIIIRLIAHAIGNEPIVFCRGVYQEDGFYVQLLFYGNLKFVTNQASVAQMSQSSNYSIAIATLYTLGISRNGATCTMYKNGVNMGITSAAHKNPATCARTAEIGIYDTKTSYAFDGKIEFLRIFGGIALSDSEHLAYHNALA